VLHEFMAEAEWPGALTLEVEDASGDTVLTLPIQPVSFGWSGRAHPLSHRASPPCTSDILGHSDVVRGRCAVR
jgi:hypothetical protein